MRFIFIVVFSCLSSFSANAGNAWYWGEVTSLHTSGSDGSFEIHIDNQAIKDHCAYDRVYFSVANMGIERTRLAFSLALAAFASGKEWGVVIDLPEAEAGCAASPTASQGAGIH